jgi:septum formation protein
MDETRLTMRSLTPEEALRYVERDQPLDCAGSYKIESLGISLFEKIETEDFTAIMGLPLIQVSQSLRELGVAIP